MQDMKKELRHFFNEFLEEGNTTGVPFYHAYMEHLIAKEEYALNLDCSQLRTYNEALYENLINYPREMISICDFVLHVCSVFLPSPLLILSLSRRLLMRTVFIRSQKKSEN